MNVQTFARTPGTPWLLAILIAFGGCDNAEKPAAAAGGTLVISAFADADILLPPLTSTGQGLQVVDAVFDRLAQSVLQPDGSTRYLPELATRWTWSADSLSIDFALHPTARWHDGQPVTANDVRFTFNAYVNPALASPSAGALHNIDSVTARDAHTATVWFKQRTPAQLSDVVSQMHILPEHLLAAVPVAEWRTSTYARHPVGTGRFRFANWQAGSRIEVVADSNNYRGRPRLDRVVWTVAPDPSAATMRLFSGDADFLESVRPDAAAEFSKHPDVVLLKSPSLAYGFLAFNTVASTASRNQPALFANRSLRRALTMAIDRQLVVNAVFDSAARIALGPVTRVQLGRDTVLGALPFDTVQAARLLDSLGWRAASVGGIRQRNGQPLRFTTLVPSSSSQRVRVAVLLQQLFRAAGVQMDVEKVEFNTLNARLGKGDFDAAVLTIGADAELSGIRGVWSTGASASHGGVNFGSYASVRFDALVDSASLQLQPDAARRQYLRAYAEILGDAPAIWLFEPWNLSGIRTSVHPVGLRPDGWWLQLGDWSRDNTP
ncbi:MAG: peptide ABC transporter substrate-binding protein [Gemmatimonadota bacterium]|nr:peptide ABC transporter substrate-binding protein [Gemmatimonadota bacterium]